SHSLVPSAPSAFLLTIRPPPRPTLFPYTTLFRSHEAQAGIQIAQRCFMGGRGLGSLAGAQVEPCEGDALRSVRDEAAPEIQMMNDVEDPLLELGGGTMG